MDIATVFAQECFDDIAKEMGFLRSGSFYYRIVNDIFLCFGFQPMGWHFRLIVMVSPLITGIGRYDDDRIVWFARDYSKEIGFNQGDHYDVQTPEKRALMKEYNRSLILTIKPELESISDLQTAYDVINVIDSRNGRYRRFGISAKKEAIILYRLGKPEQALEVRNLEYYPELKNQIVARDNDAINHLTESEFERSVEWLKKHRFCRNVVGGVFAERLLEERKARGRKHGE